MDTEDYLEFVELFQSQLREAGAGELADITLYAVRAADTDDLRPVSPREQAIGMLQAFERYLAIRDRHTFSTALTQINEALAEPALEDAEFVPLTEAHLGRTFSLGAAPDLSALRKDLQVLIAQLQDDSGSPGATE